MQRVAINGLGRIGRSILKILSTDSEMQLVAVNDTIPAYQLAYLLNFDTIYGKLENRVAHDDYNLYINGRQIRVLNTEDASQLPWRDMGIDLVFECKEKITRREDLEKHLHAGAQRVILSALSQNEEIPTIVNGVNTLENKDQKIISCASPTANCIAPIIEILGRRIGVKKSIVTTLRTYNGSQSVVDGPNPNLREGRAGASNFIPVQSSAATATTNVLPQYKNRLNTIAVQAPVAIGSIADLTILTERHTSVEEISNIFQQEAGSERYVGIVAVNFEPIVSSDIIKDSRACVVDLTMTQVVDGDLVKIISWFDTEFGFANQMIREAKKISRYEMVLA